MGRWVLNEFHVSMLAGPRLRTDVEKTKAREVGRHSQKIYFYQLQLVIHPDFVFDALRSRHLDNIQVLSATTALCIAVRPTAVRA